MVGGKGGGRPTMALAGGKDPAKLAAALDLAKELATQMAQ
jgi:alanyl-tRNA synthetase